MSKRTQIEFNLHQRTFLKAERELTGNSQSAIVRQALNNYMFKKAIERGEHKV